MSYRVNVLCRGLLRRQYTFVHLSVPSCSTDGRELPDPDQDVGTTVSNKDVTNEDSRESLISVKREKVKATATTPEANLDFEKADKAALEVHPNNVEKQERTRSVLLDRLANIQPISSDEQSKTSSDRMLDVLSSMEVDTEATEQIASPFDRKQQRPARRFQGSQAAEAEQAAIRFAQSQQPLGFRLFGGVTDEVKRLGIFNKDTKFHNTTHSETWRELWEQRLKLLRTAGGARNAWDELAEWTEQGRMYPYPIDNEYDIGSEENVSFTEHIFIAQKLDEMEFPTSGPIREFMELVCIGLSKNPYLTIEMKHEHLQWYKEYFDAEKMTKIEKLHEEEKKRMEAKI